MSTDRVYGRMHGAHGEAQNHNPELSHLSGFRIQTRVTNSAFFTPPHVSIFRGGNVSSQPVFKESANKYRATSLLSCYLSLTTDTL